MRLRELTRRLGQWLLVNDRLDLARLLDADGVHLGEASVRQEDARALLGDRVGLFRALHEVSALPQVPVATAGVLLSPVLAPRKGRQALGLEGLGAAARLARQSLGAEAPRLYALGGVGPEHLGACVAAGAWGVAAIGSAWAEGAEERWARALEGMSQAL